MGGWRRGLKTKRRRANVADGEKMSEVTAEMLLRVETKHPPLAAQLNIGSLKI